MARIKVKDSYKVIVKLFESLTGSKSMYQVFQDCMEVIALSIQNSCEVFPHRREYFEKRYLEIINNYDEKSRETITKIFSEMVTMLEQQPFQDLLGDLYMQLDMGSDALGQFFTPYHVSSMMGNLTIDSENVKNEIETKGYIKLNEPCIGGGANIIGYLEHLHKLGINYQQSVIIVGQDLSRMSSLMAYIVLSMLGCQAVIKNDDTLMKPYTSFFKEVKNTNILYTPMLVLHEGYMKC